MVFEPSEILFSNTAVTPVKSKLYAIIEANLPGLKTKTIGRRYWAENLGVEYIQQLAFREDVEAIKVAIGGNYYATCCLAAVGQVLARFLSQLMFLPIGAQICRTYLFNVVLLSHYTYQI